MANNYCIAFSWTQGTNDCAMAYTTLVYVVYGENATDTQESSDQVEVYRDETLYEETCYKQGSAWKKFSLQTPFKMLLPERNHINRFVIHFFCYLRSSSGWGSYANHGYWNEPNRRFSRIHHRCKYRKRSL